MSRLIVGAGLVIAALVAGGCGSQVPVIGDYETAIRWRDRGDYPRAEANFSRGIYHNPKDFHCWTGRGEVRAAMKNYDGAIDDFNVAIQINPKYSVAYMARGKVLARDINLLSPGTVANEPRFAAAMSDFGTAIDLDPSDEQSLTYRAMMHAVRRDFPPAISDINRAVAVNPLETRALAIRSGINILRGDDAAAAADERAVLRLQPEWKESFQSETAQLRAARGK